MSEGSSDARRSPDPAAAAPNRPEAPANRDWCATTFVVWRGAILLHHHAKLQRWLPPGGHVEPNELPDDAAVREVREETGVLVELLGERAIEASGPRQLLRPRGVQLEPIRPGHEHIDLIYFARPVEPYAGELPRADDVPSVGWYDAEAIAGLALGDEMRAWCDLALREVAGVEGDARRAAASHPASHGSS